MVTPFSSTCTHYDTVINSENFLTCITCGLELEQIFCHPDIYDHDSNISTPITDLDVRKLEENPTFTKNSKLVSGLTKTKVIDLIDKVIRQFYLPECLVKETYDHFLYLRSKTNKKSNFDLASYAIYDYFIREKIGKSYKEIIQVCNITRRALKSCEKANPKPIVNNTPKSILENFDMKSVGLNEANRSVVVKLAKHFTGTGANPYSVACSLTYIYSNLLNLKTKLTIKKVADEFKISIMSAYRLKKQFKDKVESVYNQLML